MTHFTVKTNKLVLELLEYLTSQAVHNYPITLLHIVRKATENVTEVEVSKTCAAMP